jgi:hypothetical protein
MILSVLALPDPFGWVDSLHANPKRFADRKPDTVRGSDSSETREAVTNGKGGRKSKALLGPDIESYFRPAIRRFEKSHTGLS